MIEIDETIAEVLRLDAEATPVPSGSWDLIEQHAYYRTAAPALAREVQRLQAELCEARIGHDCAIVAAYESGRRAGQEDMRYRCASHVADNADGACNCGGTILCRPDCARVRLLDQVVAIRTLEVSDD